MANTEYISSELSHFVGRSLHTYDEQYDLLIKIISGGKLLANVKNPDHLALSSSNTYQSNINGELFEEYNCVCFCDIPKDKLTIHTNKYSKFGIGLNKSFLVSKGCRPVMYVPVNGIMQEIAKDSKNQKNNPALYFTELRNQYVFLNTIIMIINLINPFKEQIQQIQNNPKTAKALVNADRYYLSQINANNTHSLLYGEMVASVTNMAFIKLFDPLLSENDPDNYYYEREWRSLENIEFNFSDISTIYLANDIYLDRIKNDLPQYTGKIICLDAYE